MWRAGEYGRGVDSFPNEPTVDGTKEREGDVETVDSLLMNTSRRCKGKESRAQPVVYTNFLLRCLADAVAVSVRDSSVVASITLDGIPLAPRYLNILCSGLKDNETLVNLSLTRCRIGDAGCDLLLDSLTNNPSLCSLNLSSCRLTNRSAMHLSSFLKRRKADLLQNIWEKSSSPSRDEFCDQQIQGLQTLILNQNMKFGDTGVRQLINALKSDVWVRSLSLRRCGITKQGAEMMIRLLQSNTVITKLDLTENHIPINTLQTILKILKRRRDMVDSVALKKRFRRDWRRKTLRNEIRRPAKLNRRRLRNRTEKLARCSMENRRWKRIQRHDRRVKQADEEARVTKDEDYHRGKKLHELESQLTSLIESNLELKEELSSNKVLLDTEAQQRSRMEDELQQVSLRLNDLKNKVVTLNCLSSNAYNECQLLNGLKCIFEKLESHSSTTQDDAKEKLVLNTAEPLWSSPLVQHGGDSSDFMNCSQRTSYGTLLKI